MKKVSPKEMLERTSTLLKNMKELEHKAVFVGLPQEKAGSQIYGEGQTVMTIGAVHEYGAGNNPERSFLRVPFELRKAEMGGALLQQFTAVVEGRRDIDTALGRVGVAAVNIVKEAFHTGGFGKWPKLAESTVEQKGFSDILEDTRVLRNSVTWVVRNDT